MPVIRIINQDTRVTEHSEKKAITDSSQCECGEKDLAVWTSDRGRQKMAENNEMLLQS